MSLKAIVATGFVCMALSNALDMFFIKGYLRYITIAVEASQKCQCAQPSRNNK